MAFIAKLHCVASVLVKRFKRIDAVIAISISGVLLRKHVQRKCAIHTCLVRVARKAAIQAYNAVCRLRIAYVRAIIKMY